jgi:hypothetical protein
MCLALAASGRTKHRLDSSMPDFAVMAVAVESLTVEEKGGNPLIGVARERSYASSLCQMGKRN